MVFCSFKYGKDNASLKSKVSKSYEPHDKKYRLQKSTSRSSQPSRETDALFKANKPSI